MWTHEKQSSYSLILLNGEVWCRVSGGMIGEMDDDIEIYHDSEDRAKAVCEALNKVAEMEKECEKCRSHIPSEERLCEDCYEEAYRLGVLHD